MYLWLKVKVITLFIQEAGHLVGVGAGQMRKRREEGEEEGGEGEEGEGEEGGEEEGGAVNPAAVRTVSPCLWPVLMLAGSLVLDLCMYMQSWLTFRIISTHSCCFLC